MFRKLLALPILGMALLFGGQVATASAACNAVAPQKPVYNTSLGTGNYYMQVPWVSARMYCDEWTDSHRYKIWMYAEYQNGTSTWSRPTDASQYWNDVPALAPSEWYDAPTVLSRIDDTYSTQFSYNCQDHGGPSPYQWRLTPYPTSCQPLGVNTLYFGAMCNTMPSGATAIRAHVVVTDLTATTYSEAFGPSTALPAACWGF